jgi:hypothetical protein
VIAVIAGSSRRRPAIQLPPSLSRTSASWLRPSRATDVCRCQPWPTPAAVMSGAKLARSPFARAAAWMVCRARSWSSAAESA